MPKKPKRPCRYQSCPNLTDGVYCEQHKSLADQTYNKYQRDKDSNKRYGRAWKRIRDRYVAAHPLCESCKAEGRIVPVQEVHHVLPLNQGGTNNEANLISLCHSCHMKIHGKLKSTKGYENLHN